MATDWVSCLVIVKKLDGSLCLCLNPKPLNRALRRCHYPIPTVDELLPELTNAKLFTVCDLKNGFWHVDLDESSSLLTTFGTPFGRFKSNRMPFGIGPALEVFQEILNDAVTGLEGVFARADDLLVVGKGSTKEVAQGDHDRNLQGLLTRCREKGIKLNSKKLKMGLEEVKYMGHMLTAEGLKADPEKITAITRWAPHRMLLGYRELWALTITWPSFSQAYQVYASH